MASGATVGSAVIKLSFDGKDVNAELKGIGKEAKSQVSGMGSKIGGAMKKVAAGIGVAVAGAATAVTGLTKAAVDGFANYEQLTGGVETLFKDSAAAVEAYASTAYKTAGLSANEYMETVTSFSASLLQSLGGNTAEAAEYANRAVTDMADNANKMGTNIESIQWAYQGFAKQNYTMLDNLKLGYGGTRGEMARLIEDASKLTDVQEELGVTVDANDMSFGNIVNAISVVQKNMGIMGTTSKEASDTIQGSISSMKGAWENLVTGLADPNADIGKLMGDMVQSVGTVAKNIVPAISRVLGKVPELIGSVGETLVAELPALANSVIPGLLTAAGNIVGALIQAVPGLLNTLITSVIQYLPTLFQMVIATVPSLISQFTQLITQIATMLTQPQFLQMILQSGIQLLLELVSAVPQVLTALANSLPEIINNIVAFLTSPDSIQMILQGAVQLFMALVMAVPQILGSLISAFGSLVGGLWNWITSTFQGFAADFGNIISGAFRSAVNGVLGFIEGFVNAPINVINGFVDAINAAFGAIGVNIGHIPTVNLPRLARGGVVDGATAAVIGEAGQEAVLPLENNTGNWAGLLASTLAIEMEEQGSGERPINIYITNEINNDMDVQEMCRGITQAVRRAA